MGVVETLQGLEPVFLEAGNLAFKMQGNARAYNKTETGNPVADIVTEADLAVQDLLLKEIRKTELINCRLLAEENTESASGFNENGSYYLAIDPIDDTAIFAKGGQHFSTIITLHDGKKVLYAFAYFPAWNWVHKVVEGRYAATGATPDMVLPDDAERIILHWSGEPEKNIPSELLMELKSKGVSFRKVTTLNPPVGSTGPFAAKKVAGTYQENMNVYDGLIEFSIASARGQRMYSSGPNGAFDLRDIKKRESGFYYPGYFLVLNE